MFIIYSQRLSVTDKNGVILLYISTAQLQITFVLIACTYAWVLVWINGGAYQYICAL